MSLKGVAKSAAGSALVAGVLGTVALLLGAPVWIAALLIVIMLLGGIVLTELLERIF